MEFCWEGYKDRGHLQNSGPGFIFQTRAKPKAVWNTVFVMLSHYSFLLSLYMWVYGYTIYFIQCVGLFMPYLCHIHIQAPPWTCSECLKHRKTPVFNLLNKQLSPLYASYYKTALTPKNSLKELFELFFFFFFFLHIRCIGMIWTSSGVLLSHQLFLLWNQWIENPFRWQGPALWRQAYPCRAGPWSREHSATAGRQKQAPPGPCLLQGPGWVVWGW